MAQASKEALCWQCRRATGGCEWSAFFFTAGAGLAGGAHVSQGKAGRRGAAGAGHTGGGLPEI